MSRTVEKLTKKETERRDLWKERVQSYLHNLVASQPELLHESSYELGIFTFR